MAICRLKMDLARFKNRMDELNWSAATLAESVGISRSHMYNVKYGVFDPSDTLMSALANALNCSVEYLQGNDTQPGIKPSFPDEFKKKRKMIKIDSNKFKQICLDHGNPSPSNLSKLLQVPYLTIKKLMASDSYYLPQSSVNILYNKWGVMKYEIIYNDIYTKIQIPDSVLESLNDEPEPVATSKVDPLVSVAIRQKEQKLHDAEMAKELAEKAPKMTRKVKSDTVDLCKPQNGMVSTGQLLTIASIFDQHPELLDVISGMLELEPGDYDRLLDQVKWTLSVLKK